MNHYNQRLFSGGIRGRLHNMRFEWLRRQIQEENNAYSLFELGCFDCRSLSFLPKPSRYVGADANWEGGLDQAHMYYAFSPEVKLVKAQSAQDLEPYRQQRFDYSISLETLEHIPDALLEDYLRFLAQVTTKRLLVTVPVELGPVFLAKYLAKSLFPELHSSETSDYTVREVYAATLGRTDQVRRHEHKGFDYRKLTTLLGRYFTITRIEGLPFRPLPMLSFQVGIIAEPKSA